MLDVILKNRYRRLIVATAVIFVAVVTTAFLIIAYLNAATSLSDCSIRLPEDPVTYSGKELTPEIIITHKGKKLKADRDFEVKYENNVEPGKGAVLIAGKKMYSGIVDRKFSIVVDPVKELKSEYLPSKEEGKNPAIKVEWEPSSYCDHYEVHLSQGDKKAEDQVIETKDTGYEFTPEGTFANYDISVYAVGGKKSTLSAKADSNIEINPLAKPSIEVTPAGCRSVKVAWSKDPNATEYSINEETSGGKKDSYTVSKDELKDEDTVYVVLDGKSVGETYTYTVTAKAKENGKDYSGPASESGSATAPPAQIGQATTGETGHGSGNKLGDQTGSEVGISKWAYSNSSSSFMNYTYMFRFKDPDKAALAAQAMEDCCNNNHVGYDNGTKQKRLSLYREAKANNWDCSKIDNNCATACSQLIAVCANAAGVPAKADVNSQMLYNDLKKYDDFEIYSDSAHTSTSENLKRGDIMITVHSNGQNNHACMIL